MKSVSYAVRLHGRIVYAYVAGVWESVFEVPP